MLHDAMNNVLSALANNAGEKEEEFFIGIQHELNRLCAKIAEEVHADSAVIFFETEENKPDPLPWMIMRGASGRLQKTLQKNLGKLPKPGNGSVYDSRLTPKYLALEEDERQREITKWSVTNQIWHLAEGRIANSNRAMDKLHGKSDRRGHGDPNAYPGKRVSMTFRNMIGVPIFAPGKISAQDMVTSLPTTELSQSGHPLSASSSAEFHSKYRVIGILKVENKHPLCDEPPDPKELVDLLDHRLNQDKIDLTTNEREELAEWLTSRCQSINSIDTVFSIKEDELLPELVIQKDDPRLQKAVADVLTECCQAQFTRQDMELLVLLAMQVGRLMTLRIIAHAAQNEIAISENEIGLLNMQWRDIADLVTLRHAAEIAMGRVKYHLEVLKERMDFEKHQEVYHAQVSEILDPKGPIREISARGKGYISLIRKLVRKQHALEDAPYLNEVAFTSLQLALDNYSYRSGTRCFARGTAQFALHDMDIGKGEADLKLKLGTPGAPQVKIDAANMLVAVSRSGSRSVYDSDPPWAILPLIYRIISPDIYGVDDLAGIRIITDYDSDVDEIVTALKAHVEEWNIKIGKIDDMRKGKAGGYRGVHVTVHVNVEPLLKPADVERLRNGLRLKAGTALMIPVEIQLRTAYQHSWSQKVHQILYKREEQIAQELRDEEEILSNVLAEADWLSDIVRDGIEDMLLPVDYGERDLLAYLERRLHPADIAIVKFGIACAKEILKDKLRYNGQPEYTFVIEVCRHLVHKFQIIDSALLLAALLYNVWPSGPDHTEPSVFAEHAPTDMEDVVSPLCKRLEQLCHSALIEYHNQLPIKTDRINSRDWLKEWMMRFPAWFWGIQQSFRKFFRQPREELPRLRRERLQDLYQELQNRHSQGEGRREIFDEWLERAYILEAAILLADLTDLPDEPGSIRRRRLYNDYLSVYREIRRYFPNSPTKVSVIEELDRTFRELETHLDLYREPDWYGE